MSASTLNDAEWDDLWSRVILWCSAVVFVVAVMFAASGGPRGTDQYWYLSDTEVLLSGGPKLTNSLFPRQLLNDGMAQSPFIHDILPQRAVVIPALVLGSYWGWITMNALAMLVGAWLLNRALIRDRNPIIAASAASSLLLLPLPFLYAAQVMSETALVPLLAAVIWLLQRHGTFLKYSGLAVVLTLALMTRFTMVPLLLLLPLAAITDSGSALRRGLLGGWIALLVGAGILLNRMLFGGVPIPGGALAFGVSSRALELWYSTEPVRLTVDVFLTKLAWSAKVAIGVPPVTMALTVMNWLLMGTATAGAVIAWRRRAHRMAILIVVMIGINVATLALYQPQVRYVVPSYPILLYATALLFPVRFSQSNRLARIVPPLLLVLLAVMSMLIAFRTRVEGIEERDDRDRIDAIAAELHGTGDVIYAGGTDQMTAYGLRPRIVLFVGPDQSATDWSRILDMPRWRWVLCVDEQLERLRALGVTAEVVRTIPHRGGTLSVIDLGDRARPAPPSAE